MDADLARLLTARHLWRPGIRLTNGYRLTVDDEGCIRDGDTFGWAPDLSDPATAGILLAMLPRGCHVTESARESGYLWRVTYDHPDGRRHQASGDTLGAACAAALISLWSDHG